MPAYPQRVQVMVQYHPETQDAVVRPQTGARQNEGPQEGYHGGQTAAYADEPPLVYPSYPCHDDE